MSIWSSIGRIFRRDAPTTTPAPTTSPTYSGPIAPGTSEEVFRETGRSVPETATIALGGSGGGSGSGSGGGGGGGGSSGQTQQTTIKIPTNSTADLFVGGKGTIQSSGPNVAPAIVAQQQLQASYSAASNQGVLTKLYSPSFKEKAVMTWRNLKKTGTIGEQDFETYKKNVAAPFNVPGKVKTEYAAPSDFIYPYEEHGTLNLLTGSPVKSTFGPDETTIGKTIGELQVWADKRAGISPDLQGLPAEAAVSKIADKKANQIADSLQAKYQKQIDENKIGTYEASVRFKEDFREQFQKEFSKDADKFLNARESARGVVASEIQKQQYGTKALRAGETAALIASGFNPATAAGVGSLLMGRGAVQLVQSQGSGTLPEERLPLAISGVSSLLFGGTLIRSGIGPTTSSLLSRQNVSERLREIAAARARISGEEVFQSAEGSIFKLTAERMPSATAKQTTELLIGAGKSGLKGEALGIAGAGKTETSVYDFVSGSLLKSSEPVTIGGRIFPAEKGIFKQRIGKSAVDLIFPAQTQTSVGTMWLSQGDRILNSPVFGASLRQEGFYNVFGGVQKKRFFDIGRIGIRGEIRGTGQIKAYSPPATTFVKTTGKKGSSKLMQEQSSLFASAIAGTLAKTTTKQAPSTFGLITPATTTAPAITTSKYYGTGQYERTEESPTQLLAPIISPSFVQSSNVRQKSAVAAITSSVEGSRAASPLSAAFGLVTAQPTKTTQSPASAFGLVFRQAQAQRQTQRQATKQFNPFFNASFSPLIPKPSRGFYTPPGKPESESEGLRKSFGFIPEIKSRGKWLKLSGPVSRQRALATGARAADFTLARSFRIIPSRKKIKREKYSAGVSNLYKFRTFTQRKGKRSAKQNLFIEKSRYALEPSEVRLITPLASRGKKVKRRRR